MIDSITGLSVTVDAFDIDDFETAARTDQRTLLEDLLERPHVEEALVLRTCQRFEVFWRTDNSDGTPDGIETVLPDVFDRGARRTGIDTVEHLLRTACGIESKVLGEDEILGQLREARQMALDAGGLEGPLEETALRAIRAGERARSETAINEGVVSLGSLTVDHVRAERGSLSDATVLVIGAGEVGTLVSHAFGRLDDVPETILIANRTLSKAEHLAAAVNGSAISLSDVTDYVSTADVLVTATGSRDRIFGVDDLRGCEVDVVDLATPRDVTPSVADLDGVSLATISELTTTRDAQFEQRTEAIPAVERIIADECNRLETQLATGRVDNVLADTYTRCHRIRDTELERAFERLQANGEELTEEQATVIEDLSKTLVNNLLHHPAAALREIAVNKDSEAVAIGSVVLPGGAHSLSTHDDRSDPVEHDTVAGSLLTDRTTALDELEASVSPRQGSDADD